jgi:outer membrane lipoprotein-sorting protein
MSESVQRLSGFRRLGGLVALAIGMLASPAQAMSPQELLAASDAIRNPPGSFSVRLQITEYRQSRQTNSTGLLVYARPSEAGGEYRNLVRFMAPARDAGKLMLRNGQDLWFYDPANRASVRISPQQRLLGQASNGDVMTTRLAQDYAAEAMGSEEVRDGEGQQRKTTRLALTAQRTDVAYARVDYWVEEGTHRPVMAKYYTAENRLLKTAWFRRFKSALGAERPTETVIVDGLDPQWVTLMQLSQHTERTIPEQWLQRDYLPRFTAE